MQHSPRCVPRPFFSFSPCHRSSSAATHLTQRFSLPLSCVPPCMFVCEAIYICLVGPRTQRARVTAERGTFLLFRGTAAVPCVGNQITFRAGNMCAAALSIIYTNTTRQQSLLCTLRFIASRLFEIQICLCLGIDSNEAGAQSAQNLVHRTNCLCLGLAPESPESDSCGVFSPRDSWLSTLTSVRK